MRQYSVSVDTQQREEREHGILGSKLETGNRRSEQNSAATSVKNKDRHNVTDMGIEIAIKNF